MSATKGANHYKQGINQQVVDCSARPPELYAYLFASGGGTVTLSGRFVDARGNTVVLNPGADAADQVSKVEFTITEAAVSLRAMLRTSAIDDGDSGTVQELPVDAVGFVGFNDAPFYMNTNNTRVLNNDGTATEAVLTNTADSLPSPTADPQIPVMTYLTLGRVN